MSVFSLKHHLWDVKWGKWNYLEHLNIVRKPNKHFSFSTSCFKWGTWYYYLYLYYKRSDSISPPRMLALTLHQTPLLPLTFLN